jgi:hypothetical protein
LPSFAAVSVQRSFCPLQQAGCQVIEIEKGNDTSARDPGKDAVAFWNLQNQTCPK